MESPPFWAWVEPMNMVKYQSSDYVTLYERVDHKKGRLSAWTYLHHMSLFSAKHFLHLVAEEELRESGPLRGVQSKGDYLLLTLKMKGPHEKRQRAALKAWEEPQAHSQQESRDHCLTATRKWILSTIRKSFEADTSPEAPDENLTQPTLWFQPWDSRSREPAHTTPDFWLTEWEMINGCCFKPFRLWYFTMQQQKRIHPGNQC